MKKYASSFFQQQKVSMFKKLRGEELMCWHRKVDSPLLPLHHPLQGFCTMVFLGLGCVIPVFSKWQLCLQLFKNLHGFVDPNLKDLAVAAAKHILFSTFVFLSRLFLGAHAFTGLSLFP
mgnify:CR=1 FL=1